MFDRSKCEPKKLIEASLRGMVRDLDAGSLGADDATALVAWFARVERLAVAGRTIAAGAVAASGAWQRAGARSAAEWLARQTGSTVGEARTALETGERLAEAPGTNAAFRSGALSAEQADAVSAAAVLDPVAEGRLLAMAGEQSLQKLRDEAARVRAAADPDPAATHERVRKARFWRKWTDRDGARCGSYRTTPEQAALLEAAAQPFVDAAIDAARRSGEREPFEAYAIDGLADMAASTMPRDDRDGDDVPPSESAASGPPTDPTGSDEPTPGQPTSGQPTPGSDTSGEPTQGGETSDPPTQDREREATSPRRPRGGRGRRRLRDRRELIGVVNLESLNRGTVERGEMCEIAGVGPVPVAVARELFGDALLRIVIRDGVDIRTVVHAGRTANALQETAVLVRSGGRCERPSCGLPISEIDHTNDWVRTHQTTLDDLAGLCGADHDLKSRHGRTYRRRVDGTIDWQPP